MSATGCPDLETLFTWLEEGDSRGDEHAAGCEACAAILEEHRQLEKDLLRLSDPLPPPDFVQQVMAKVEAQPVPMRREVWTGVGIFAAALVGIAAVVMQDAAMLGAFGTAVASVLTNLKAVVFAAVHGLGALWSHAALPTTVVASFMLMSVLVAVRRLAMGPKEVRVTA